MEKFLEGLGDKTPDFVLNIVMALLVLVVGWIVIKAIVKLTRKALEKTSLDASAYKFIISVLKFGLYIVLIVIILTCLDVPTTPLVTVIGACGAAIALALKDNLSDVASGLIILVKKPFKQGDLIMVSGEEGRVHSIDINVTTIKTANNMIITIPNRTVTGSVVVNKSAMSTRRVDIFLGIAYDADIGKARDVLISAAEADERILKDPKPELIVTGHGASAIELKLKLWVDTENYFPVEESFYEKAKLELDAAGIEIPYDQIDVHLRNTMKLTGSL